MFVIRRDVRRLSGCNLQSVLALFPLELLPSVGVSFVLIAYQTRSCLASFALLDADQEALAKHKYRWPWFTLRACRKCLPRR